MLPRHAAAISPEPMSQNPAESPKRPWAAIIAAGVLVLPLGSIYAFSVFLKPLETLLGASRSELATVFGIAAVCYTFGMNLGPYLFRPLGTAGLFILSALASAGGTAIAAAARTFPELALGYGVLFGIGGGLAFVAIQQGVNLMGMRRTGLVNGYLVSLLPLGAMLSAPACGWGIARFGVRETLAGMAVLLIVSGLAAVALARLAGMSLGAGITRGGNLAGGGIGQRAIFWKLFAVFFLAAAAGLMVLGQAAGIVAAYGGETALAYAATTGLTAAIAAARLGGGSLVDRLSVPGVMAGAQFIACLGAIAVTVVPTAHVSIAALVAIGMGYGVISGATAAGIADYWRRDLFGRVAAKVYIAWCAAAVTLPILAARLFDLTGGYHTAFIIAGAANLAAAIVALTLPRQGG